MQRPGQKDQKHLERAVGFTCKFELMDGLMGHGWYGLGGKGVGWFHLWEEGFNSCCWLSGVGIERSSEGKIDGSSGHSAENFFGLSPES